MSEKSVYSTENPYFSFSSLKKWKLDFWKSKTLIKLYKWEFWPFWFFYIPVYFYWLYLGLRARAFCFFSAANPLMELGGFSNYSKFNVLRHIPTQYLPKTAFIENFKKIEDLDDFLAINQLSFPLIAKPDRGERGSKVHKIENLSQLRAYLSENTSEIILQEFIDMPLEFGVMYCREPNQKIGTIYSLVQKKFLSVRGDGVSTVSQLLQKNPRANLYLEHISQMYPEVLKKTPQKDENCLLEPIGNHCRGTVFLNANHLINPTLIHTFDQISQQIEGFYFGRYDLKAQSIEDLYQGKNIKIMELNGANSEPAHIYDPQMPIWRAYQDLFKHWKRLYRISVQNHQKGVPYTPLWEGIRHIRQRIKRK